MSIQIIVAIVFVVLTIVSFLFWLKVIITRVKSTNSKVSKTNKLVKEVELPNFDEETQYHNNKSEYKQSPNEKYMSLPEWIRNSNDYDYD